ncbi:Zn(II)2Cys6 transcription factor [Aspergillus vadensis CBS 113365]|uniref:Zn(II)2Cys6 transcription factor n=1 Tax=Aspergillus vadensis (strain CBS 113365 / IMI 142717 / IBT 24658) TaxID=1448311 RepID=A0A319B0B6_ASPVC|nr:Zn(II)2Cys6 transcription factor [Aspergillus vadensis CBS 113365]PYH65899.1 Zn(II)2Cys6 transcription factor [Aspergillus vadensis CBS 113365]
MADVTQGTSRGVRKPRKSRGRGLRATTGCLICKRRHVKCDEARPQCGPCAKGQRDCVYGSSYESGPPNIGDRQTPIASHSPPSSHLTTQVHLHEPLRVLVDVCQHEDASAHRASATASPRGQHSSATPHVGLHQHSHVSPSASIHDFAPSPATDSSVSTRLAPLSWFELLANDAVNADRNFFLSSPHRDVNPACQGSTTHLSVANLQPHNARECQSFQAASFDRDPDIENRISSAADGHPKLPDDPSSWSTSAPIQLSQQEHLMFKHFVRNMSGWYDFFDPTLQISSKVPHLAMRNIGVMKALLALSARHLSIWHTYKGSGVIPYREDGRRMMDFPDVDRNIAVQYYYETLQYLNKAMQYPSYAYSHEIISTSLLISTYEMVDGSNRDWERHLKGVFWIQRYQNNDGECGGLRQAIWWAWLRQDVWVAMRERRRIFSFWKPKRHISSLSPPELASFVSYILGQCVNYASREESASKDIQSRLERGNELLYMLQEWQDYLPPEFNPLPCEQDATVFPPIWVHPPPYAAALQIHSLARILVLSHRPTVNGFQDYRAAQKLLTTSVNTICGIARTIREDDLAASLMSLYCIYGAGMSVHTPHERAALLELIDVFESRVCWPRYSLRNDLEAEYRKDGLSGVTA